MTASDMNVSLYKILTDVLREQFTAMQAQIPGILADTDSEPLHDFRVASRRSRAALSQMKPAFAPDTVETLMDDYRVLGGITNRLRDLDVFVESFDGLTLLLPTAMRDDAQAYFKRVLRRRKREAGNVLDFFQSDDFMRRMKRIDALLNGPEPIETGALGTSSALQFASAAITAQYEKVIESGQAILSQWTDPGTVSEAGELPDKSLHRMRIKCKKLRYMIEFSKKLLDGGAINALIAHMKDVQDMLGSFNDLSVQSAIIAHDAKRSRSTDDVIVLGALQAIVFTQKSNHFNSFRGFFDEFSSKKSASRFQKVFG